MSKYRIVKQESAGGSILFKVQRKYLNLVWVDCVTDYHLYKIKHIYTEFDKAVEYINQQKDKEQTVKNNKIVRKEVIYYDE